MSRPLSDEEEEYLRQRAERRAKRLVDRVYDTEPETNATGGPTGHMLRRTGRVFPVFLRVTLRTRAIMDAIMQHHQVPGVPTLYELMLDAYLQKYGPLPEGSVPSDEVLVERYELEKDMGHDKPRKRRKRHD